MRTPALLLIGTAVAAIAMPSFAQTTQEATAQAATPEDAFQGDEIIVTATKRATTVQDVPFSINAQTEEDIQRANAVTIEDLSRNIAGLTVQNLGPGQSQVSVRGVSAGQIVRDQPGVKEQVGVYLDESVISLSLFTPDLDLFDLNRVETLRGPQGTLFGSGSVGGTIRYITNQPKLGTMEGLVEANINTVDEGDLGYHLKGAINLPLGDTAAVRAVAYGTKYGGFINALGPAGGKDVNDGSRVGGRLSLLWEPTANVRLTPRVVYQKIQANGFNREEVFNLFHNEFNGDEFDEREQYLLLREKFEDETLIADFTGSVDFGGVELTSITTYTDRDILVSRDASALTGSVSTDALGFPDFADLPSNLRDTTTLKSWTQEVRLASTGSGPFQWVVGGFYSDVERVYAQRLPTPGYDANVTNPFLAALCFPDDPTTPLVDESLDSACADQTTLTPLTAVDVANGFPLNSPYNADLPYDIKQKAVFGEASYDFGQFKLTAGGRYYDFKESRDFVSGGIFSNGDTFIGDKTKSSGFSPRVIGTWEPTNYLSVNLQAAKGFRLGGVNDPLNLPLCTDEDEALFGSFQEYDDETLWNYEAGVKYSRRGMTFNAAVFHSKIKDLQVTLDAGSCSSRIVFNVPKAHTTGVEAEFAISPAPGFDLSFAGSYVSAEFDSTIDNPALITSTGIREGNRLPTVPKFQMAATASYGARLSDTAEWYVNASYQHVGSRYTQPADQENNPRGFVHGLPPWVPAGSITTIDLKLPSYNLVNLSAGVTWDSGLEVVAYVNNLFDENALLSFDRERGGRARLGYNIGTPRTIGLTARYRFASAPAVVEAAPPPPPPPPPPPATQTCADGSVILATEACPVPPPPPPPPPPAPERG
jgi:iron complex outermembrane receptor protein